MHHFRYSGSQLFCEDVSIESLAKKFGTPLYVYSQSTLKDHFGRLDEALAPLDLDIHAGEIVTLIGPSGCGKSTLLRLLAGLIEASAGVLRRFPAKQAHASRLAFVFQSATLMPWASVEKNVRLPLELARLPMDEANARVENALGLVGLAQYRRLYPRELSGGMQMRVSIARALVTEPRLLLMDEPFGALDEITRNRLDRDLLEVQGRQGLTLVFVTHSLAEAVFLSDRVLVMTPRPGRIFAELAIDEPFPRTDEFRVSERYARLAARLAQMMMMAAAPRAPIA